VARGGLTALRPRRYTIPTMSAILQKHPALPNTVRINVHLNKELHRKLKIWCAEKELTLQWAISMMIEGALTKESQ
jgi:hypothetical protein